MAAGPDKDEVVWLVKSGDRVLGPFSHEEIKRRLYDKEIVVIDEVIKPLRRWCYIRDEPSFAVVVEEIRKSSLGSREDTELGTLAGTQTGTTTHTELTQDIDPLAVTSGRGADAVDSAMIKDAEAVEERRTAPVRNSSSPTVKQYGSGQDQRVQQSINKSSRWIWLLTIVILLGAGGAFWYIQIPRGTGPQGPDIGKIISEADLRARFGRFRDAAARYREAFEMGYDQPDFLLKYAAVALKAGDERGPVRFIDSIGINRLSLSNPKLRAKRETIQGLAALIEAGDGNGRLLSQARDFFASARQTDPESIPARFNLAVIEFLDLTPKLSLEQTVEEFSEAEKLASASSNPLDRGSAIAAQLMIARTRLKSRDPFQAERMREYLSNLTPSIIQYWQEATLLRAYSTSLVGKPDIVQGLPNELKSMMSADPFLTEEHYIDPLLYVRPLAWNSLHGPCMETVEAAKGVIGPSKQVSPYAFAAREFCNYKKGDKPEAARKALSDLLYKNPSDILLKSLLAYFKMSLDEASAAAELRGVGNQFDDMLGVAILGRLCPDKDYGCISRQFSNSTLATPDPAFLLLGAARNDFTQNDERSAEVKLSRIRQKSPHYIPLLILDNERDEK